MSQQQNISIDSRKLFNLAANLISAGFYKQKPEEAKKLFKTLKQGNLVKAGELKSENNNMIIPVKLALDYSAVQLFIQNAKRAKFQSTSRRSQKAHQFGKPCHFQHMAGLVGHGNHITP